MALGDTSSSVRRLVKQVVPSRVLMARNRRHRESVLYSSGAVQVAQRYLKLRDPYVLDGPFKGLRYPPGSELVENIVAKLVGGYEQELVPFLATILEHPPELFIDIGCSDGFYAVGFAVSSPTTTVYAFDIDPVARRQCHELAKFNRVEERVHIHSACTLSSIARMVGGKVAFVLSDCEGAELDILTHDAINILSESIVLVELHDVLGLRVESEIVRRFSQTHAPLIASTEARDPDRFAALDCLSPSERVLALDEFRPGPMRWACFFPR